MDAGRYEIPDGGYPFPDGGYSTFDRWSSVSSVNGPGARVEHVMAWSGSEVLLFGGTARSGAAWNPATDTWRPLPTMNQPIGYARADGVWTGSELIVWGGGDGTFTNAAYQNTGARYVAATNTWQPMSTAGAPSPRWLHRTTWTGSELMVFGGYGPHPDGGSGELGDGALYNPSTDSWRPLPTLNAPSPRYRHEMVLAGNEVIVFGGCRLNTGARFNLTTNQWTPMSTVGAPSACGFVWSAYVAAWTGSELLLVGEYDANPLVGGYRYDPRTDTWGSLPRGDPCYRTGLTGVWTGTELLVWGGASYSGCPGPLTWSGYRFRAATNSWVAMSRVNEPTWGERIGAVWTGSEMVLYGSRGNGGVGTELRGRYRP